MSMSSSDLTDYVRSVVEGVNSGLPRGFNLHSPIKFEVSIAKVKEGGGGFKIVVAEAGAKYTQEETSKITFEVAHDIKIPGYRSVSDLYESGH